MFEPLFVTEISTFPSPSKSPIEIPTGLVPVIKSIFVAKLPVVILPLVDVFR